MDIDIDLSEAAQKRLKHKRRGGDSNAQGNRYEQYFALAEIVRWAATHWEERDTISFSEQAEDAFVDDFMVVEPKAHHFSQLKSGNDVAWGDCLLGSICFDFQCQICQERRKGQSFQLYLVGAQPEECQRLATDIPKSLQPETSVRHFPLSGSTIEMLISDSNFRSNLVAIHQGQDNLADLDALSKWILGNWMGSERKSISLEKLMAIVPWIRTAPHGYVDDISDRLKSIFNVIDGFEYQTNHGRLEWKTDFGDKGVFHYPLASVEFSSWEIAMLANPPQDFESLEPMLAWTAP